MLAQASPSGARPAHAAAQKRRARFGAQSILVALYAASVALLFASRVREFADESDNLLGGVLLAHGERLYVDYFSSHMPFAYYLAAVPALFGAVRVEEFRPFTNVLLVATTLGLVWAFRRRIDLTVLLTWAALTVFAHTLQFGEMLTAGTTAGFGCLAAGMLFYATPGLQFSMRQAIGLSAAICVAVQSELLSVYPLLVLAVAFLWVHRARPKEIARIAAIALVPQLLVLAALALQGVLAEMVYDAVQFNQTYYSQFLMSGSPVQMLHDWEAQYRTYLLQSVSDPLGIQGMLVLANLGAAILVWSRRGVWVGLAYYAFAALSHIRTEDGYYLVSYMSIALLLVWATAVLRHARANVATLAAAATVIAGLTFAVRVAATYQLGSGTTRSAPEVALVLALTQPGERIFVAPYDPYVYLATDRMPATTSPFYFPWQAIDPRSQARLIADLRSARPPVIVFRHSEAVNDRWVAGEYGAQLLQVLGQDYAPLDPSSPVLSDVLVPRERLAAAQQRVAALLGYTPAG